MDIYSINAAFVFLFSCIYLFVCFYLKTFINIFTPFFLVTVASRYILDVFYFSITSQTPDISVYFLVYSATFFEFFSMVAGFLLAGKVIFKFQFFDTKKPPSVGMAWGLLFLSFVLYSPVLISNLDLIFSPRDIYTATRTGAGPLFFGSLALAYLSYVVYLFSDRLGRVGCFFYYALIALNFLLHGNKSPLVVMFFMYLIYSVVVSGKRYSFFRSVYVFFGVSILIVLLFVLTLSESMKENLVLGIAGYSDYNRNFALVVERPPEQTYGKLTLDGQVWPLVPRFLYPEKPKNFGTFALAEHYFPSWFDADTGSPAFGLGVAYADFRGWIFLYVFISMGFIGFLLRVFFNRLRVGGSPADFIMMLFLSGVSIVELGVGYQLIPHFVLSVLVMCFFKIRFFFPRSF